MPHGQGKLRQEGALYCLPHGYRRVRQESSLHRLPHGPGHCEEDGALYNLHDGPGRLRQESTLQGLQDGDLYGLQESPVQGVQDGALHRKVKSSVHGQRMCARDGLQACQGLRARGSLCQAFPPGPVRMWSETVGPALFQAPLLRIWLRQWLQINHDGPPQHRGRRPAGPDFFCAHACDFFW